MRDRIEGVPPMCVGHIAHQDDQGNELVKARIAVREMKD